jgi:hypothetical protein
MERRFLGYYIRYGNALNCLQTLGMDASWSEWVAFGGQKPLKMGAIVWMEQARLVYLMFPGIRKRSKAGQRSGQQLPCDGCLVKAL